MSAYSAAILGTTGLVSYWRMAETATPMADAVASNTLAFSSTGTISTAQAGAIANDANTAVRFSGSAYLGPGSVTGLTGSQARSVEMWLKCSSNATNQNTICWGSDTTRGAFGLSLGASGTSSVGVWAYGDDFSVTGQTVADGNWHHHVGTYNGNVTMRCYWDGVQVGGDYTLAGTLNTGTKYGIYVASHLGGLINFFTGTMDEVATYSVELNATQIKYHYNLGKGIIANDQRSRPARTLQSVTRAATL